MIVDAFAALLFGWLYDRIGIRSLILSTLLSTSFSILIFLFDTRLAIISGIILWGIGMGAQESIMKAAVSRFVPRSARSTGFGIFETGFGIAWFAGSWLLGALYDVSIPVMVAISVGAQLLAVPFYAITTRMANGD